MKQYFRELMQDHDNTVLKSVLIDLLDCRKNVVRDVRAGRVQVNQQQTNIEQMLYQHRIYEKESEQKSKRLLLQKQLQNLNRSDYENDEAYKKAKQQLIMQRQQQIRQQKQQKERRKKEVEQKVKKWSQQQKQLLKKKEQKANEEQKVKQMQEKAERIKKQEQKKAAVIEKRKLIQQSLKNIEQNRMKREDMIRSLRSQSQEKIPLFKEIQKRNQMLNDQREFQQNQAKRKYKIQMKIDYEDIKNHQRMFLTKIQQRNKRFQESRTRAASSMPDSEFNIYTNRSQQKVKEQLLKKNRRWKYQQKIKQIPIQIDQAKKVKIQIALDKSKNPFKYNFLSQKSLNEFQIYGQFKNFSINSNPRQIGKNYLEELKKIPKQSRIQKSSSVQFIKQSSISDRPQYRNYLAELKSKRPQTKQEQKDEIKRIISKSKNKDEAYKSLQKKSDELEVNVQQKMKQLKSLNSKNIKNILKKQSEIDEVYAKALKARLACLEIVS